MSNAEKADLLPCPFCGKSQEHFHRYSRKIGFDVFYCIRCYCCAEAIGQTEQEVEQSWNTRVQPDQQVQGEPVTLPGRQQIRAENPAAKVSYKNGWNACLDEIAKLGPLYTHPAPVQGEPDGWQYRVSAGPATGWSLWNYGKGEQFKDNYKVETRPLFTHADPAEVERLRANAKELTVDLAEALKQQCADMRTIDALRAQLAEMKQGLESQVVEGLRADAKWLRDELDKTLLQLAEAHALLREWLKSGDLWRKPCPEMAQKTYSLLSASAEPEVKS